MRYKYQLITLGSHSSVKDELITMLYEKLADLGLAKEVVKLIDECNFGSEYIGNQPAFVYYFGDVDGNFKHVDITKKLIQDGTMILPIYFNPGSFSREIPKILENQNGIEYKAIEKERIVNITLEAFELLRNPRKIFISYRRSESTSIAIQLYEALESHNFDVFLDTHSIGKGEPFQDELWHRMTDCDVILLLNTPEFLESHWCKEEFAEAGAKQIGIVQLVWPNHDVKMNSTSHLSYPKQLSADNFVDGIYDRKDTSKLKEEFVEEIIKEVESVRARNLAARQDNLITDFRNIAEKLGKKITVQPEKFLSEDLANGRRRLYIPTIGIPQSTSCQSAEIRKELLGYADVSIRLIYDDLRIRDKWLKHLDWLNDNFKKDIKTLKKTRICIMANTELKNIFLSASVPLPDRDPKYVDTADIIAIRDAVIALTSVVLPHHRIIWGGHPSITPLIYYVMEKLKLNIQHHVILYQSRFFEKVFPADNNKFENVILTENLGNTTASIEHLRERIFAENSFSAAIFIGGMEGIIDEFNMFREKHPNAFLLPVASTGAASKIVYDDLLPVEYKNERLEKDYGYMALFQDLLMDKI